MRHFDSERTANFLIESGFPQKVCHWSTNNFSSVNLRIHPKTCLLQTEQKSDNCSNLNLISECKHTCVFSVCSRTDNILGKFGSSFSKQILMLNISCAMKGINWINNWFKPICVCGFLNLFCDYDFLEISLKRFFQLSFCVYFTHCFKQFQVPFTLTNKLLLNY